MQLALGLIETKGLIGAIEAADAGTKAANVKLISKELSTGALVTVKFEGEVAAVKSAVDAGSAAAQRVGQLISSHVIPRPDNQIDIIVYSSLVKEEVPKKKVTKKEKKIVEDTSLFDVQEEPEVESQIDEPKSEEPLAKGIEKEEPIDEKDIEITDELSEEQDLTEVDVDKEQEIPPMEELEIMNVHSLRKLARGCKDFPIKGREISKDNRRILLDYFKNL